MLRILLFFFLPCIALSLRSQPPIGQWRDHLPMRMLNALAEDQGQLVASSAFGVFRFDEKKNEFLVKTRSSGLSGVRVRRLSKEPNGSRLMVVYENADLDIIEGDRISNVPDILLSRVQGDKTIHHVSWTDNTALLSSSLGIIAVNTQRNEVRDTYRPSSNGTDIRVNQTAIWGGMVYAATEEGLKKVSYPSAQLADFRTWTTEPFGPRGQMVPCHGVLVWGNRLIARHADSLFMLKDRVWSLYHASSQPISSVDVSNNQLIVGRTLRGKGSVLVFDSSSLIPKEITSISLADPAQCLFKGSDLWVADRSNGLLRINASGEKIHLPNGPYDRAAGPGLAAGGKIWIASGRYPGSPATKNQSGFFAFGEEGWTNYNRSNKPALDSASDILALTLDPASGSLFAGSFGGGLVELDKTGALTVKKQQIPLSPARNEPGAYRVSGLAMDQDLNLWIANHGAVQNLLVRKRDGNWKKFTIPFVHKDYALGEIFIDDLSRKWIISPDGNGLFCFDDKGTIDNENDDRWRYFRQGKGAGNLPSSTILSLAIDRNGFVWVGTDRGIGVIQCLDDVFNPAACEATLPIVQQDNFAGLLFADEQVNDIEVDGANRKWIATNNGVWLIAEDGQKTVHHFNARNSSLLSDQVYSVVVDPKSGEVFFMTANGICSYRSTATAPVQEKAKPFVFPNPVPSSYTGTIAIRELPERAWVRITELDGRLVYETRSLGGQAIWNGKNYKGERMSSGVYLVMVSNEDNTQRLAAKIFFMK